MSSATLRPCETRRSSRFVRRQLRHRRRSAAQRRARYSRPLCETLEPRVLLATVTWDGDADNLWGNPLNWHDEYGNAVVPRAAATSTSTTCRAT